MFLFNQLRCVANKWPKLLLIQIDSNVNVQHLLNIINTRGRFSFSFSYAVKYKALLIMLQQINILSL
uniref:Uncharacterized protein n=1 Tax=Anguilla anguilla TaxID=7936 RepID=A0A0E9XME7_ANGAN